MSHTITKKIVLSTAFLFSFVHADINLLEDVIIPGAIGSLEEHAAKRIKRKLDQ